MQDFIMGGSYYNMVAAVLLVMNVERARSVQGPCANCPAGTFCGKSRNPIFVPCPPNSLSCGSGQRTCVLCRRCEGVFRTKRPCSPTSDTECECIAGFHCLGPGCSMCEQDCEQGQEFTKEGCKDCPFGSFNNQKGGICQPWTNCSGGRPVLANGTKDSDVVCGPTAPGFSPGASSTTSPPPPPAGHSPQVIPFLLALTWAAVLFLVFFLVLHFSLAKRSRKKLLYIFKQPFMKPIQTAQEEDACSCQFPEEEEGGYEP
nr:tumor necrosis factor receptor superfamily member 9 [Oryctolagus cuniculus]XP_051712844.1 tumor necrosis factor receptor superfamily member 9 [Oryctolagus cuniculus]XP_051712845.1 tumor necrosis factor receptor superfamily member 9 [Oryctolagus cuniculus]XP_051712846.1 tumor necrosis factor receptor superfamily member 9 [Oryctolagus cuniculus]